LTATSWRLWTSSTSTERGWLWDVELIEFYAAKECSESSRIEPSGKAVDSGNAGEGYLPSNGFAPGDGVWGGRQDLYGTFWIGMEFSLPKTIQCIKFTQPSRNGATELYVQVKQDQSDWMDVWHARNLIHETNRIQIGVGTTAVFTPTQYFVEVKYDRQPKQISWWIKKTGRKTKLIKYARGKVTQLSKKKISLSEMGKYLLALRDSRGNGFCCRAGKGYAKIYAVKGETITVIKKVRAKFRKKKNVPFTVPLL